MFGILYTSRYQVINVRRNVRETINRPLIALEKFYLNIRNQNANLFWSYEGYIVRLLGCADSTQWTHPVCLLCISTCCAGPAHCELIISPVTQLCSLKISCNGCARINVNLGNIELNLLDNTNNTGETGDQERRVRNSCVPPDWQSDASDGCWLVSDSGLVRTLQFVMFTGAERLRNVSGEWSKFQSTDPSDDNRGLGTAATWGQHHESARPI